MPRILVVEDEEDLRELLAYNLKEAGYEVLVADNGNTALDEARTSKPDLMVLDLMMPGRSGLEVCRTLKADPATRSIPVIMVTAKREEIDRVVGFEIGADDYVVKPYSVRELLLRIQVVLRRNTPAAIPTPAAALDRDRIVFGNLTIDRASHRVWVQDAEVRLTALEFRLLGTLFERRDRVQSRGSLLEDVWDSNEDLATRTVDTHVKRLREKLGSAGDYIETVRGVGYRFVPTPD
jgi:two-component system, OmpR family, phosphate regulon response regulator PhoB